MENLTIHFPLRLCEFCLRLIHLIEKKLLMLLIKNIQYQKGMRKNSLPKKRLQLFEARKRKRSLKEELKEKLEKKEKLKQVVKVRNPLPLKALAWQRKKNLNQKLHKKQSL